MLPPAKPLRHLAVHRANTFTTTHVLLRTSLAWKHRLSHFPKLCSTEAHAVPNFQRNLPELNFPKPLEQCTPIHHRKRGKFRVYSPSQELDIALLCRPYRKKRLRPPSRIFRLLWVKKAPGNRPIWAQPDFLHIQPHRSMRNRAGPIARSVAYGTKNFRSIWEKGLSLSRAKDAAEGFLFLLATKKARTAAHSFFSAAFFCSWKKEQMCAHRPAPPFPSSRVNFKVFILPYRLFSAPPKLQANAGLSFLLSFYLV